MVLPSKVSFSGPHFLTVDVCKNIFIAPSFHALNYCIWYSGLVLRIFFFGVKCRADVLGNKCSNGGKC